MPRSCRHALACALAFTGLLATAPAALSSLTETITVVERQVDVNPGEMNPCTGTTGTIIDDEQDVFHITSLANGTHHLTGHSTVKITFTPDDPGQVAYEGHETFAVSESSTTRSFVTTSTSHVRVKGTDGSFITVREVAHLTVSPTGATRSFDKTTFNCS